MAGAWAAAADRWRALGCPHEAANRQIAERLFVSAKTASVHATNLLAKLGARSRLEAAATACRLGLEQPTALERQVPGPAGRPAGRGRSSILALIRNQSDPRGRAPSR